MMCVYNIDQLIAQGKSIEKIVTDSVRLSESNIDSYNSKIDEIANWVRLREINRPFFVAGYVDGELVGQCAMTLLTEVEYANFLNGSFDEDKISGQQLSIKPDLIGYISTLTIISEYRSGTNLTKLLNKFVDQVENTLVDGMGFKVICGSAYSKSGAAMMRSAGFSPVKGFKSKGVGISYTATWGDILSSRLVRIIKKRKNNTGNK